MCKKMGKVRLMYAIFAVFFVINSLYEFYEHRHVDEAMYMLWMALLLVIVDIGMSVKLKEK